MRSQAEPGNEREFNNQESDTESFNWETLLWVAGSGLLIFFMLRGCGGMMGGGCGMGGRRSARNSEEDEAEARDEPQDKTA